MFIPRNLDRTEHDDFVLNVQRFLNEQNEALPIVFDGNLFGWRIQDRFS